MAHLELDIDVQQQQQQQLFQPLRFNLRQTTFKQQSALLNSNEGGGGGIDDAAAAAEDIAVVVQLECRHHHHHQHIDWQHEQQQHGGLLRLFGEQKQTAIVVDQKRIQLPKMKSSSSALLVQQIEFPCWDFVSPGQCRVNAINAQNARSMASSSNWFLVFSTTGASSINSSFANSAVVPQLHLPATSSQAIFPFCQHDFPLRWSMPSSCERKMVATKLDFRLRVFASNLASGGGNKQEGIEQQQQKSAADAEVDDDAQQIRDDEEMVYLQEFVLPIPNEEEDVMKMPMHNWIIKIPCVQFDIIHEHFCFELVSIAKHSKQFHLWDRKCVRTEPPFIISQQQQSNIAAHDGYWEWSEWTEWTGCFCNRKIAAKQKSAVRMYRKRTRHCQRLDTKFASADRTTIGSVTRRTKNAGLKRCKAGEILQRELCHCNDSGRTTNITTRIPSPFSDFPTAIGLTSSLVNNFEQRRDGAREDCSCGCDLAVVDKSEFLKETSQKSAVVATPIEGTFYVGIGIRCDNNDNNDNDRIKPLQWRIVVNKPFQMNLLILFDRHFDNRVSTFRVLDGLLDDESGQLVWSSDDHLLSNNADLEKINRNNNNNSNNTKWHAAASLDRMVHFQKGGAIFQLLPKKEEEGILPTLRQEQQQRNGIYVHYRIAAILNGSTPTTMPNDDDESASIPFISIWATTICSTFSGGQQHQWKNNGEEGNAPRHQSCAISLTIISILAILLLFLILPPIIFAWIAKIKLQKRRHKMRRRQRENAFRRATDAAELDGNSSAFSSSKQFFHSPTTSKLQNQVMFQSDNTESTQLSGSEIVVVKNNKRPISSTATDQQQQQHQLKMMTAVELISTTTTGQNVPPPPPQLQQQKRSIGIQAQQHQQSTTTTTPPPLRLSTSSQHCRRPPPPLLSPIPTIIASSSTRSHQRERRVSNSNKTASSIGSVGTETEEQRETTDEEGGGSSWCYFWNEEDADFCRAEQLQLGMRRMFVNGGVDGTTTND